MPFQEHRTVSVVFVKSFVEVRYFFASTQHPWDSCLRLQPFQSPGIDSGTGRACVRARVCIVSVAKLKCKSAPATSQNALPIHKMVMHEARPGRRQSGRTFHPSRGLVEVVARLHSRIPHRHGSVRVPAVHLVGSQARPLFICLYFLFVSAPAVDPSTRVQLLLSLRASRARANLAVNYRTKQFSLAVHSAGGAVALAIHQVDPRRPAVPVNNHGRYRRVFVGMNI